MRVFSFIRHMSAWKTTTLWLFWSELSEVLRNLTVVSLWRWFFCCPFVCRQSTRLSQRETLMIMIYGNPSRKREKLFQHMHWAALTGITKLPCWDTSSIVGVLWVWTIQNEGLWVRQFLGQAQSLPEVPAGCLATFRNSLIAAKKSSGTYPTIKWQLHIFTLQFL